MEIVLPELVSLHKHAEAGVRYFSGTATYSKTLPVSADAVAHGKRLYVDLGRVEVLAEIRMNGRDLGTLWKPPYRVDVTEAVRPGDVLRLEVDLLSWRRGMGTAQGRVVVGGKLACETEILATMV